MPAVHEDDTRGYEFFRDARARRKTNFHVPKAKVRGCDEAQEG
jgi:hypothetical protein